ncbi:MAG: flagellar basal body rod protein FlgC [Firmicutes bacterium]|jgi:flagellar basal-body rod protein FlgC|nr:flagellar basal body rod protein FlgC [Bacillota bacterium]MCL5065670.1 flagellar basal body rod protein FlgC [Bacillota bacterium]
MFDALHISATGLGAETVGIDVVANNLANQDTTATPAGGPYQTEFMQLVALPANKQGVGQGVEVGGIYNQTTPTVAVYDPTNPQANAQGNVLYPNVSVASQMVDMIQAESAYQANANAFSAETSTYVKAFTLGA